jgi:hypothetical protein
MSPPMRNHAMNVPKPRLFYTHYFMPLVFQAAGHVLHSRRVVKSHDQFFAAFKLFEFEFRLYKCVRAHFAF